MCPYALLPQGARVSGEAGSDLILKKLVALRPPTDWSSAILLFVRLFCPPWEGRSWDARDALQLRSIPDSTPKKCLAQRSAGGAPERARQSRSRRGRLGLTSQTAPGHRAFLTASGLTPRTWNPSPSADAQLRAASRAPAYDCLEVRGQQDRLHFPGELYRMSTAPSSGSRILRATSRLCLRSRAR